MLLFKTDLSVSISFLLSFLDFLRNNESEEILLLLVCFSTLLSSEKLIKRNINKTEKGEEYKYNTPTHSF